MKLLDGLAFIGLQLPGSKRWAALRSAWTHPGDADGWSASWYFDQIRKRLNPAAVVDEKTWSDLEFPRFFKAIDTTISLIGRQYLFAQLRIYEYEKAELDERHHGYDILQGNRELRENIQLALGPLELDSTAYIADLLIGPEPKRVPHGQLVLPWMLLTIVAVGSALVHLIPLCWVAEKSVLFSI
jgi:hypothetical protein